jgi:hypothetical protein
MAANPQPPVNKPATKQYSSTNALIQRYRKLKEQQ